MPNQPNQVRLTPRRADIIALLGKGLSGTQIARELDISSQAANTHIRQLRELTPVLKAREELTERTLTKCVDVVDWSLDDYDIRPAIANTTAINILKGLQVLVPRSEQDTTETRSTLEVKRLEMAIERKLLDQFALDADYEVVSNVQDDAYCANVQVDVMHDNCADTKVDIPPGVGATNEGERERGPLHETADHFLG